MGIRAANTEYAVDRGRWLMSAEFVLWFEETKRQNMHCTLVYEWMGLLHKIVLLHGIARN